MQSIKEKIGPDWDTSTPLYIQLANNLRQLISDGDMQIGDALPSERSLTEMTGASRVTIRKAIDQLIDEGLLLRRQGAGTYIAPQIEQSGEELTGFSADAVNRGESPTSIWLVRSVALPTEDEAKHLHIGMNDNVVRLGRVRLSNGEPLAIEHAVVSAAFFVDPENIGNSLYSALEKTGNRPVKGTQKLRASLATPTEAGLLSTQEGSEVLRIERHTFLADGTPIEYTRSAYRGDKYVFVTELHECHD
jgi:GntR family transcriptional regulator